ncbi:MAG: DUF177 domain-containing protein [bacterium]
MIINVSELLKALGNTTSIRTEENLEFAKEELDLISPVFIDIRLTNTGRGILMEGSFKAEVKLSCSRCLKEFRHLIEAEVSEVFKKERKHTAPGKDEIELAEEDFVFPINEENEIDLREAVRQSLILALPIKTVCSLKCSKDLAVPKKEGQHDPDPRLAKLKEWKGLRPVCPDCRQAGDRQASPDVHRGKLSPKENKCHNQKKNIVIQDRANAAEHTGN